MNIPPMQTNWENHPGYANRWKGLLFLGISLLVVSLDNTVLSVAIPSISRTLGASASELQWIVDAYILVFAALLLTTGALSDRLGRKRALQVGLMLFGIGSLVAALSPSTTMLIGARAFLGLAGAIIMPSTLSIISATFPPQERPRAIAMWAAVFGLGLGIGPLIGGLLLESFEWNSVFLINLPVVVIALIGGALFLTDSKDDHAPQADVPGVLLSIPGLFALIFAIIHAGAEGWTHPEVLAAFGIAALFLVAFALWESRAPNAMLPLYFFKNMSFTGANTALSLVTFSLMGSMFFMSQYLQSVLGYTALGAGIRMLPMALTLSFVTANSARVAARLGVKRVVALGIFIAACGLLLMSQVFTETTPYITIGVTQMFFALGMGLTMSPATASIMQSVPVRKAGIGSAMNDTTRQLGGALGVAVLGTVMNRAYIQGMDTLHAQLPQLPADLLAAISSSVQGAHIVAANAPLPDTVKQTIVHGANMAFVNGMTDAMLTGALIMFGAALLVLLILPAQVQRPQEDPLPAAAPPPVSAMPQPEAVRVPAQDADAAA